MARPYLQAYLRDPSKFYDEQRHRRLMPKQDMSDAEIADLVAFLDWVSKVDNQGWPPRPILRDRRGHRRDGSAAGWPGGRRRASLRSRRARAGLPRQNPIALGEIVFRTSSPACTACHSLVPGVNMAGPSLAGVGDARATDDRFAGLQGQGEGCRRLYARIHRAAQCAPGRRSHVLGERSVVHA